MRSLVAALLLASCMPCPAQAPPRAALPYRADLVRSVRLYWGLDGPVAAMAAQVHQESAWQPDARSPYAHGLAQFTPATAEWISGQDEALAGADTGNPVWALRALARYDRWLYDRVPDSSNACTRWWQTLRAYNGGLGYVRREAATGQPCESFRAGWACRENLAYPRMILTRWQSRYAGWGPMVACQ